MDLLPNAEEESVIEAVAQYLQSALPVSRLHNPASRDWTAATRANIAELGWYGLALPDDAGGSGFSTVEQVLLFREFGRYLGPIEVLPIVLAAHLSAAAGDADFTRAVVSGEHTIALAFSDYTTVDAEVQNPALRLFGHKNAQYAVHVERNQARLLSLEHTQPDLRPCLDKSISMAIVPELTKAVMTEQGHDLFLRAQLATAAMLTGVAEAVLDMIVSYAKVRTTFGRPIGSYQAVRHPAAEMALRCEAARQQLFAAAVALRDSHRDANLQVTSAKLMANDGARRNVDSNTQLHGGIGITQEHDGHLFLKRAHLMTAWFGEDRELLDSIHALSVADALS